LTPSKILASVYVVLNLACSLDKSVLFRLVVIEHFNYPKHMCLFVDIRELHWLPYIVHLFWSCARFSQS
jgi:hypothetical protein